MALVSGNPLFAHHPNSRIDLLGIAFAKERYWFDERNLDSEPPNER